MGESYFNALAREADLEDLRDAELRADLLLNVDDFGTEPGEPPLVPTRLSDGSTALQVTFGPQGFLPFGGAV